MPPISNKQRAVTPEKAAERLEALCVKAERCSWELRQKLYNWQIPEARAEEIMRSLTSRRFVDDARFARSIVHDKVNFERRGRLYLRQYLRLKRIGDTDIENALAEIDEDVYLENLMLTLKARLRLQPDLADTFEGRTKLFRHAVSRGYEPALVSSRLKALLAGR